MHFIPTRHKASHVYPSLQDAMSMCKNLFFLCVDSMFFFSKWHFNKPAGKRTKVLQFSLIQLKPQNKIKKVSGNPAY